MSVFIDKGDGNIAVLGVSGELLMCVSETKAQQYIKQGQAYLIRRNRTRVLQATAELEKPGEADQLGRGTALGGTFYSNRKETEFNPPRVWTLKHQITCTPFMRVLADCMA